MHTSGTPKTRPRPACCSGCRRCALPDVAAVVGAIDAGLRAVGTPERAANEKRYLKSDLEFYGATVPAMRSVVRDAIREHELGHDEVVAIVDRLWSVPAHERRMAAVDILEFRVAELGASDLPFIERLIRQSRTWALVDGLAISVTGTVVIAEPHAAQTLDRWLTDGDFWVRRAALLALITGIRAGRPDLPRIERFSDALLEEKEFFIRKAIGWLLRELAKKDPDRVVAFIEPRRDRASGLTVREALKPIKSRAGTH